MATGTRVQLADGRCGVVVGIEVHFVRWCDVRLDDGGAVWLPALYVRAM